MRTTLAGRSRSLQPATPAAFILATLVLALAPLGCSQSRAPDAAAMPAPFPLPDAPRPHEWTHVGTGPDGRFWFCAAPFARPCDLSAIRASIARAFSMSVPGLHGAVPLAFEPGGRVWFECGGMCHILGYDGQTWIEHPISSGMHGDYFADRSQRSLCAVGAAFFRTQDAVEVYDGAQWLRFDDPRFAASPRSRFCLRGEEIYFITDAAPKLLRWHAGAWMEIPGFSDDMFIEALGHDGAVWVRMNRILRRFVLGDRLESPAAALVGELISTAGTEAQRGVIERLEQLAPEDPRVLEEALAQTYEAQVLEALVRVGTRWKQAGTPAITFGEWTVTGATACAADAAGTLYFDGGQLSRHGEAAQPGTLLVLTDGRLLPAWIQRSDTCGAAAWPLALPGPGNCWWIPGRGESDGARCIDLASGEVVESLCSPRIPAVAAALPDGRLVVGARGGWDVLDPKCPGPADSPLRAVPLEPLQDHAGDVRCAVDEAGQLWLKPVGRPLSQFTATGWLPSALLADGERVVYWRMGHGGDMLMALKDPHRYRDMYFAYLHDGQIHRDDELFRLVQQHQAAMVEAFFHAPMPPTVDDAFIAVIADRERRLWVCDRRTVKILAGTGWIPLNRLLTRDLNVDTLVAIGDGSRVLLGSYPRPVLAGWRDGKFTTDEFTDDLVAGMEVADAGVPDRNGDLWMTHNRRYQPDADRGCAPTVAARFTAGGVAESTCAAMRPLHADGEGNVWFATAIPEKRCVLTVRSPEGNEHEVIVPGATEYHTHIATDSRGTAFVSTPLGVFRLRRGDGAPANAFVPAGRCPLTDVNGVIADIHYVQPGHLLVQTFLVDNTPTIHLLAIVE